MSEAKRSTGALTRRSFLKTTGAAAAGLGLVGATGAAIGGSTLAPAKANAEGEERVAYTFHQTHCGGNCSLKCTVREGRLCLIEPNDGYEDSRFSTCCLKGLSEVQHIYSPERIQTPLKRVGERGAGQFEAISWDEAYEILKSNLEEVWQKYGKSAVMVRSSSEAAMPHLAALLGAQTSKFAGIDMGLGNGFDPAFGHDNGLTGYGYCAGFSDSRDWVHADFMLNVGCNYLETSLVQSACFFEAKEAGCKIVTVDPHFSTTAQKSDEWLPIRPGTDGALYLGMVTSILDEELHDDEFVRLHTSLPFLVSDRDGSFLSLDPEGDAARAEDPLNTEPRSFAVLDEATGRVAPFDAADAMPSLKGSIEVNGVVYVPAFAKLVESQRPYTLDWAAEKTGIEAEKIAELARAYATAPAAVLSVGYGGNDKMANADIVGHAAAVLVALTGQAGRPGATAGNWAGGGAARTAALGPWTGLPEECVATPSEKAAYDLRYDTGNTRAIISVGDTFQQAYGNLAVTEEWVRELDFICVMDIYHMNSADYADLVLPVCSKFECDEEIGGLRAASGHVLLREQVIDPLFDSKTDYRIQYEIAELFGYGDALPVSAADYAAHQLATSADETIAGITLETLKAHQGVQPQTGLDVPRRSYLNQKFGTKTKRVEVYYDGLLDFGQALPVYEEPLEACEDNALRSRFPLLLTQVRTKYHIHNQFYDAAWIQQFNNECVELNPIDLEARGLSAGENVRVYNDRGAMECPVVANEAVRPGCARIQEGAWSKFVASGNFQALTNDATIERGAALMLGPVIPFNDTLVEVEKA